MQITMLGTGSAMVTECYNTCFLISDNDKHFMVDGGGGNMVLRQLKYAGYHCMDIHEIFVTHKHIDHLMGVIWVIRTICQCKGKGSYNGKVNVYAHEEVIGLIKEMLGKLLWKEQINLLDQCVCWNVVEDGEKREILGREVTFFDIQSIKDRQFGFCIELEDGEKLTCCGDESYHPCERVYVENSKWLLHEAFCLHSQADIFNPYEKHHKTVKDACEMAEELKVKNLILYHTEDSDLKHRKDSYYKEGSRYYHGNLYIPEDLETILL